MADRPSTTNSRAVQPGQVLCPKCGAHSRSGWCRAKPPELKNTPEKRFDRGYVIDENGCWVWTGTPNSNGYAKLSVKNRTTYAHRFAYERFVGPIPDGMTIDHLCRVRACVNPAHLEPVSLQENCRRRHRALPEKQPDGRAKLGSKDLVQIIAGFRRGMSNKAIAASLPVDHALISRIRVGRSWVKQARALGWEPQPQFVRLSGAGA